jgi:hypothetical protein
VLQVLEAEAGQQLTPADRVGEVGRDEVDKLADAPRRR